MARIAVRLLNVTAITAISIGIAGTVAAPSLLAQSNATIQASVTIVTPPSSQQTLLATPDGAQRYYTATPALQTGTRTRLADRRGSTFVSAQAVTDARATTPGDELRPRVRLTIEFAAN